MSLLAGLLPIVEHFGLGLTLLGACVAAAVFLPVVRTIAIAGAVALALMLASYGFGEHDGSNRVTAQWSADSQRVTALAGKARDDAEASIPPVDAVVPASKPVGLRHAGKPKPLDKFDRL